MTTNEPMTPQERALRDRLQASLVPPTTPDRLVYAINRLAEGRLEPAPRRGWRTVLDRGMSRGMRAAIAIAAVVVLGGGSLLIGSAVRDRTPITASPLPTLPAITQPSLPPDAASPMQVVAGRWLDANSAYVVGGTDTLGRSGGIFVTIDGGQTWKQSGWMQGGNTVDTGFDLLDATHGYLGVVDAQPTGVSLSVNLTDDGGATWRAQPVASITSPAITAAYADHVGLTLAQVHFADPQHGVALATLMTPFSGSPLVACASPGTDSRGERCTSVPLACRGFATSNGGVTWSELPDSACHVGYMRWSTPQLGLETTPESSSDLSTTMDGGMTWHTAALPGLEKGKSFLSSASVLTVVGGQTLRLAGILSVDGAGPQPLSVWESSDAGATWQLAYQVAPPTVAGLDQSQVRDIWAFSADHWIAMVGADAPGPTPGGLFETWDAGRSWTNMAPQHILTGSGVWTWADRLHGMTSGGRWVCAADNTCSQQGTWLLTNDGGQTWHGVPISGDGSPSASPAAPASPSPPPPSSAPAATPSATSSDGQLDLDQAAGDVAAYGTTVPGEFAGVYLDQASGHVVALFTANLELHRQALIARIGAAIPLDVRQAKYTERDLVALQDRIGADMGSNQPAWLQAIPAMIIGAGPVDMNNWLALDVSSANPNAAALILAHYGLPADMLHVQSDGTGVALMPRGWVDVSVKAPSGVTAPPGGSWSIDLVPDGVGAWGGGDIGYGVEPGSKSAVPATVGGWTVNLTACCDATVVGSGHVTIAAGRHVPLVITVR